LTDAGIAVIVALSNDANETGKYVNDLYTEEWPSTEPTALCRCHFEYRFSCSVLSS
jgi:hypothetical protein